MPMLGIYETLGKKSHHSIQHPRDLCARTNRNNDALKCAGIPKASNNAAYCRTADMQLARQPPPIWCNKTSCGIHSPFKRRQHPFIKIKRQRLRPSSRHTRSSMWLSHVQTYLSFTATLPVVYQNFFRYALRPLWNTRAS